VDTLFAPMGAIRELAHSDALAENPRFRERGARRVDEHVFLITTR
jgi:hypothetical protein